MQSIVRSSLINTAAGILSLVAGFGSSVIVARLLGVEASGTVAYALWIMTLATLVSDFGMPQLLLRFIGTIDGQYGGLVRAVTRRFALSTGITTIILIAYAIYDWRQDEHADALIWAATTAMFLSYAYSTMTLGATQGLGEFSRAALYTVIGCLLQLGVIFVGALLWGIPGAMIGHALRHLPQALALRHYLKGPGQAENAITPAMSVYAKNNWISGGLSTILNSRVELAVLGLSFSLTEVGYYAIGMTMTGMVLQLAVYLMASLVPYFSYQSEKGDHASLTLAYQRSARWLTIVLAPICFGGAAIAPVLIPLVFGQSFLPAVDISMVLLAFSLAAALSNIPIRLMLAKEHSGAMLRLSVGWGVISLLLLFAIVPVLGEIGAAWVKGLAGLGATVHNIWYCHSRLKVPFAVSSVARILVSAAACALAAYGCLLWLPNIAGMVLACAAGGVVYPVMLILLNALPVDERHMIVSWSNGRLPAPLAHALKAALFRGQTL